MRKGAETPEELFLEIENERMESGGEDYIHHNILWTLREKQGFRVRDIAEILVKTIPNTTISRLYYRINQLESLYSGPRKIREAMQKDQIKRTILDYLGALQLNKNDKDLAETYIRSCCPRFKFT